MAGGWSCDYVDTAKKLVVVVAVWMLTHIRSVSMLVGMWLSLGALTSSDSRKTDEAPPRVELSAPRRSPVSVTIVK